MADGERLIWADTTSPGSARRRALPVSLLGWLFLLLALAWMAKAATASFWLLLMGLPFLAAALALALLTWWWPRVTRHTVYAISDRRLLIIRNWPQIILNWPRRRVTSYGPDEIDVVERREHRDGTGDLVFRHEEHGKLRHHHDHRNKRRMRERPVGFFGVPDVKRLEAVVWALKERRYRASRDDRAPPALPDAADPSALPPGDGPAAGEPPGPRSA